MNYFFDKVFPGLLGTFMGAALALRSKSYLDSRDQRKKQRIAGNFALFGLAQYINFLLTVERLLVEWRDPSLSDKVWFCVPMMDDFSEPPALPIEDLDFLLSSSDPNLLGELVICRNLVLTLKGIIEKRNQQKVRANEFLERELGQLIALEQAIPWEFCKKNLSPRLQAELSISAEVILTESTRSITFIHATARKLERALREKWPGEKFIIFPETPPQWAKSSTSK